MIKRLSAAIGILLVVGCSTPYRQISREYGKAPETTKDSFYLSGRCLSTFPIDTTTRTEYILLPQSGDDSTEYYRDLALRTISRKDSIRERLRDVYRDTCTTADDVFDQAFDVGYQVGNADGMKNRIHDTIQIRRTNTVIDATAATREHSRAEIAETARDKYRGKLDGSRRLVTWLLAFVIALLAIVIVMSYKKSSPVGQGTSWISKGISLITGLFGNKNSNTDRKE